MKSLQQCLGFICLDKQYSTTRTVVQKEHVIESQADGSSQTVFFLPENKGREGEGGLRTKGYFKRNLENRPLITVVTVIYNGEQFLEETILSVLNQSYDNVEYIIIDGGSTDNTLNIIRKYEHAIDYWISEKDHGIYDAMNNGVKLSSADWINFMNAGDYFNTGDVVFSLSKEIIKADDVDVFYSDINFLYKSGTELFKCNLDKEIIVHQSVLYKKSLHKSVGANYIVFPGFNTSDYLFFRLISNKKWVKTNFVIAAYSPYGVSACLRTYRNKLLINSLFKGNILRNFFLILIHPVYNKIKLFIRKIVYRKY